MSREYWQGLARERLSEQRYRHTLAVARLSKELAERYGADTEAAESAGLLHDLMKEQPLHEQMSYVEKAMKSAQEQLQRGAVSGIILDNPFQAEALLAMLAENPNVCHSVAGCLYAQDVLGVQEEGILWAIRSHTTGRGGMSLLEKIVYTADAVSYDRSYPDAERLRQLALADLEGCMLEIIDFTVNSLLRNRKRIAPDTILCYNSLLGALPQTPLKGLAP